MERGGTTRRGVWTWRAKEGGPGTWESLVSPSRNPAEQGGAGDQFPRVVTRKQTQARREQPEEALRGGRPKARGTRAEAEGNETSEGCIGARKSGNGKAPGPDGAKAARVGNELEEGMMTVTQNAENISTGLLKVMERAKDPQLVFTSLAHLLNEDALTRAFHRIRKDAAVGVDGVTKEQYERELENNIRGLHQRLRKMGWRHQPIRRVHIPKEKGKTRPIGISTLEDKIVQGALREVLEAVYEPLFHDNSYGFSERARCTRRTARPQRKAHRRKDELDTGAGRPVVLRQHRSQAAERGAPGKGRRWEPAAAHR